MSQYEKRRYYQGFCPLINIDPFLMIFFDQKFNTTIAPVTDDLCSQLSAATKNYHTLLYYFGSEYAPVFITSKFYPQIQKTCLEQNRRHAHLATLVWPRATFGVRFFRVDRSRLGCGLLEPAGGCATGGFLADVTHAQSAPKCLRAFGV